MNEVGFRNWMAKKEINRKVQSDMISRLKKIEREIEDCDIDEQYRRNQCDKLMALFRNKGINDAMKQYPNARFPIGKYHMNVFRYAVRQYVRFCDDTLGREKV